MEGSHSTAWMVEENDAVKVNPWYKVSSTKISRIPQIACFNFKCGFESELTFGRVPRVNHFLHEWCSDVPSRVVP